MNHQKIKLADLGWNIARLIEHHNSVRMELIIVSPASEDENFATPATSICISGMENIQKLQKFLNEAFPDVIAPEQQANP